MTARPDDDPHGALPEEAHPSVRRPGPHGAEAHSAQEEEAIERAFRRAEKETKHFQEIHPRIVTAAEAVSALSEESEESLRKKETRSRACFVATAAYGDIDAPQVEELRRFRDHYLLPNPVGSLLVRLYYRVSPPFAHYIARRPALRLLFRRILDHFRPKTPPAHGRPAA